MGIASIDSAARVCHAPSTVGLKETIGVGRVHLLAAGRDRERPRRAVGHEPGQQPAGVHEVPLPGQAARLPGGGGQPLPRARARALLGAVEPRVGAVRHEDLRPPRAGATRRRRRARQRRAQAPHRAGRRRRRLHRRPHHRLGRARRRASTTSPRPSCSRPAGVTAEQLEAFVDLYAGASQRGARLVDGHHPAPRRGRRCAGHRQPRPGPRQRRSRRRRAHADPRALGRAGRRRDGRLRHGAPRRRAQSTPSTPRPLADAWGFPVPDAPGRTAPEMVDAAAAGRPRRAVDVRRQLPRGPARPAVGRRRPRSRAAAGPPGRGGHLQMLAEGDDVLLLPVATRYEQEGGGTVTTPSGGSSSARRSLARWARPGASGGCSPTWRRGCGPSSPSAFRWADEPGPARGDRRVVPAYAGIEALRTTGDQVQWGGRHLCAGGEFPLPDGRGRFTRARAAAPRAARRGVHGRHAPRASSSTRWCTQPSIRSPAPARDAVYIDEADARALGAADGAAVRLRSADRHLRRAPEGGAPPGPVACRCTGRRATCSSPAARPTASRARRCPTTTPSSPSRCCRQRPVVSLAAMPEPLVPDRRVGRPPPLLPRRAPRRARRGRPPR